MLSRVCETNTIKMPYILLVALFLYTSIAVGWATPPTGCLSDAEALDIATR